MKIWTGKLKLNAPRNEEGPEVDAKVILSDSGAILFEVNNAAKEGEIAWRTAKASEIHAASWLRALGETGQAIGLPAKGAV